MVLIPPLRSATVHPVGHHFGHHSLDGRPRDRLWLCRVSAIVSLQHAPCRGFNRQQATPRTLSFKEGTLTDPDPIDEAVRVMVDGLNALPPESQKATAT